MNTPCAPGKCDFRVGTPLTTVATCIHCKRQRAAEPPRHHWERRPHYRKPVEAWQPQPPRGLQIIGITLMVASVLGLIGAVVSFFLHHK